MVAILEVQLQLSSLCNDIQVRLDRTGPGLTQSKNHRRRRGLRWEWRPQATIWTSSSSSQPEHWNQHRTHQNPAGSIQLTGCFQNQQPGFGPQDLTQTPGDPRIPAEPSGPGVNLGTAELTWWRASWSPAQRRSERAQETAWRGGWGGRGSSGRRCISSSSSPSHTETWRQTSTRLRVQPTRGHASRTRPKTGAGPVLDTGTVGPSCLLALVLVQGVQQVLPPFCWRTVGQLRTQRQEESGLVCLGRNQVGRFCYLSQLQMIPVSGDEGQNLVQLKVFLLAADGQVVERQVDDVHPAQRQTAHVLTSSVTHGAQEQIEPGEPAEPSKPMEPPDADVPPASL